MAVENLTDILFETKGAVLVVTFNRPDKDNTLTAAMAKALHEKLKSASENRTLRALLLRGNGGLFMNGQDMSIFNGDMNAIQERLFQKAQFCNSIIREFQAMERPIIAAVNGRVSGFGLSLMLASDLVIASKKAIFNSGFTVNAMVPDGGTTFFLPRKVGAGKANEILLLNEDFSADKAEQWGLVSKIVEDDALQTEALAWAEKIASGPTRIYGATKRILAKTFENDLNGQLSQESAAWSAGSKTFDFREAIKALAAKREPKFTGA